ncbi:MAG: alpha/beta hydrolase family protein [Usitatibacteraceae bacterium]
MTEQSCAFGEDGGLIGTICLPDADKWANMKTGVVLFNAGVVHRIGPHRINVRLARRLAAKGIPSIRFDLAGQGDSARSRASRAFEEQAVHDIRAAMDFFGSTVKISKFVLFGFCSGGVHSYEAAKVDDRVKGLMIYDTFIYRTAWSRVNRYIIKFRSRGFVSTLIRWGRRRLKAIVGTMSPNTSSGASAAASPQAGIFVQPGRAEFSESLGRFARRGMRVLIVYSGSFEQYNYRNQFSDAFREYAVNAAVTSAFLPAMDHTATLMERQQEFIAVIEQWCLDLNASLTGPA